MSNKTMTFGQFIITSPGLICMAWLGRKVVLGASANNLGRAIETETETETGAAS